MACRKCGKAADREVEVTFQTEAVITAELCDSCLAQSMEGLRLWRAEFQRLLRAGVSREEANRLLCERIDEGERPPVLLN